MSHVCPWWFAYTFDNPLRKIFHRPDQMFSPYVSAGMSVADVGCGMGYFSIGLAKLVESTGTVHSVDIQEKMLNTVRKRAAKQGLSETIHTHRVKGDRIVLPVPIDFALAFWMVHEVPDIEGLMEQIFRLLKPGGRLMIAEPKFHVSLKQLNREIGMAKHAGFGVKERPGISLSHSVLLGKP